MKQPRTSDLVVVRVLSIIIAFAIAMSCYTFALRFYPEPLVKVEVPGQMDPTQVFEKVPPACDEDECPAEDNYIQESTTTTIFDPCRHGDCATAHGDEEQAITPAVHPPAFTLYKTCYLGMIALRIL